MATGILLSLLQAQAPDELRLKLAKSVYLNLMEEEPPFFKYEPFENINRIPLFKDDRLKAEIAALETQLPPDYPALNEALSTFVRQFGILNFRQEGDLDYVWKLGQMREILRDTASALFYYAIALKNHSLYDHEIRLHYDSLRAQKRVDYVDLDYYYKLVGARLRIDTFAPPKGVLLRLGKEVNTEFPDYAPFMHPSGNVLIFTSRREDYKSSIHFDPRQVEDLYYTERNFVHGNWMEAVAFPDRINSPYNEGSACLNESGTELFFTRCNSKEVMGLCDLFHAKLEFGEWTVVENLGPDVNSEYWDSHPSLSPDGKALFFCSNRPGGFGRTDLYVSYKSDRGRWGPAQNLGPVVNTIEDEITPHFHQRNNTLYFSSTGHIHNYGRFDIFKSRFHQGHWEEPLNLGPLVNTPGDEYYFSIDGRGDSLYYAAAKPNNPENFDLFSFAMPMGARPDATARLNGYLMDSATGRPLTGIVVAVDRDYRTEIEPIYINRSGYFEFRLVNGRNYTLLVLGDNAIRLDDAQLADEDSLFSAFVRSISENKPLILNDLEFETNSWKLTPDNNHRLEGIVKFLTERPYARLVIRGHTDSDGEAAYNQQLSARRAQSLREHLLARTGLAPSAIVAEGYGESRPVYPNDSPENKARNRRVEFELIIPRTYRRAYLKSLGYTDEQLEQDPSLSDTTQRAVGLDDEEEEAFSILLDDGLMEGGEFELNNLSLGETPVEENEFRGELLEEGLDVNDVLGEPGYKVLTIKDNKSVPDSVRPITPDSLQRPTDLDSLDSPDDLDHDTPADTARGQTPPENLASDDDLLDDPLLEDDLGDELPDGGDTRALAPPEPEDDGLGDDDLPDDAPPGWDARAEAEKLERELAGMDALSLDVMEDLSEEGFVDPLVDQDFDTLFEEEMDPLGDGGGPVISLEFNEPDATDGEADPENDGDSELDF